MAGAEPIPGASPAGFMRADRRSTPAAFTQSDWYPTGVTPPQRALLSGDPAKQTQGCPVLRAAGAKERMEGCMVVQPHG